MAENKPHIAIFLSFSGSGGVEKMVVNLAQGFFELGCRVDMVIARAHGVHLQLIPEGIRQIRLGKRHTLSNLPGLARYLKREKPDALLAVKDRGIKVAILARRIAGYKGTIVGRLGTTVSEAICGKGVFRRYLWYGSMRLFFPALDHVVAVSEGVAQDILAITGLPETRVTAIPNPVVTPELNLLAGEDIDHPWLRKPVPPVVIGMGRLTEQKDFFTLIRAFFEARKERTCRLIIVGEGRQRESLSKLIADLDLEKDVSLPGFVSNPYAWLSRSSLFVLSSKWEGSPNALTEALALGIPVVSTNCRSGPNEILKGGKYGELVAVGDWKALGQSISRTLAHPLPSEFLKEASAPYTVKASCSAYLEKLFPTAPGSRRIGK